MILVFVLAGVAALGVIVVVLLDFLADAYPERFPRLAYLREWGETGQKP